MNIAVMFGGTALNNIRSFYVKDKTMYDFQYDKPYIFHEALSPNHINGIWNYCFFGEKGYFLDLKEWEDELPDIDVDVIVYANERHGLDEEHWDKYSVARLKDKYPNTKVLGFVKEITVPEHRYKGWIRFLNDCDIIITPATGPMQKIPKYSEIQSELNKKMNFITAVPNNIESIYDNFYTNEKDNSIYVYLPSTPIRKGQTLNFAKYISEKYNIPLVLKPKTDSPDIKIDMSWKDYMNFWTPCLWHFNLDPMIEQQGQQGTLVANVGSIQIGGLNESHQILFPETATCDLDILEKRFVEYLNNPEKRFEVIEYAWNKLNELYGEKVVKKQLEEVLSENNFEF